MPSQCPQAKLVLTAVLVGAMGLAGQTTAQPEGPARELRPGVLFDQQAARLFTTSPDGNLQAIAADSGAIEWQSSIASRPIARVGDAVLALASPTTAGRLEWALLGANDGVERRSGSVALPDHVLALTSNTASASFTVRVQEAAQGQPSSLTLHWQFTKQTLRGMPSPEGLAEAGAQVTTGAFSLDPSTGTTAPTVFRAAPPRPDIELASAERVGTLQGRQFWSSARDFVLNSTRVDTASALPEYDWSILGAGGEPLGALRAGTSYAPFTLFGRVVVHEARPSSLRVGDRMETAPLRLRAVDLDSGRELWTQAILDLEYSGTLPP